MIKLLNLWSRTFLAELTMLQPVKKLNLSVYFKHQEIIKKKPSGVPSIEVFQNEVLE